MIAPCKGCNDREVGCHGKCDRYALWKDELKKNKQRFRLDSKGERDAVNLDVDFTLKLKKMWRK